MNSFEYPSYQLILGEKILHFHFLLQCWGNENNLSPFSILVYSPPVFSLFRLHFRVVIERHLKCNLTVGRAGRYLWSVQKRGESGSPRNDRELTTWEGATREGSDWRCMIKDNNSKRLSIYVDVYVLAGNCLARGECLLMSHIFIFVTSIFQVSFLQEIRTNLNVMGSSAGWDLQTAITKKVVFRDSLLSEMRWKRMKNGSFEHPDVRIKTQKGWGFY